MALTKTVENDKIEVVNKVNVQVRTVTVIKEDDVEISRTYTRKVLLPGRLDSGGTILLDTDISGEDADVQAICNAAWTTQVKADYKTFLINAKNTPLA